MAFRHYDLSLIETETEQCALVGPSVNGNQTKKEQTGQNRCFPIKLQKEQRKRKTTEQTVFKKEHMGRINEKRPHRHYKVGLLHFL